MGKASVLDAYSSVGQPNVLAPSRHRKKKKKESYIKDVGGKVSYIPPPSRVSHIKSSNNSVFTKHEFEPSVFLKQAKERSIFKKNAKEPSVFAKQPNSRSVFRNNAHEPSVFSKMDDKSVFGKPYKPSGPPAPPSPPREALPMRPPPPPVQALPGHAFASLYESASEEEEKRFAPARGSGRQQRAYSDEWENSSSEGDVAVFGLRTDGYMDNVTLTAILEAMGQYTPREIQDATSGGKRYKDAFEAISSIEEQRKQKSKQAENKKRKKQLEEAKKRRELAQRKKKILEAAKPLQFARQRQTQEKQRKKAELKQQLLDMGFPNYKIQGALKFDTVEQALNHLTSPEAEEKGGRNSRINSGVYDKRLPAGWDVRYDNSGKRYFSNHLTKSTSWEDPRPLPPFWSKAKDKKSGRWYFKNAQLKKTQWEDPRGEIEPGNRPR